jgi:hypothetical protein
MRIPVNAAGIPPPTSPLRREAIAASQRSAPSGVPTMSTCGAPGDAAFPSSGSAGSSSCPAGCEAVPLARTLTGVSSAASTGWPASAASIASSSPAFPSAADSRALALSTQPAETGAPSSMPMTCAARSGGTFPYAVSRTAAAFRPGP